MLTLKVDQKDVDTQFRLKDLLELSKVDYVEAVKIRGFATLKDGGVVWLV